MTGVSRVQTAVEGQLELLQKTESWELIMPSASVSDTTQLACSQMINNLNPVLLRRDMRRQSANYMTGPPFPIRKVA
jgi:hypothetical protein